MDHKAGGVDHQVVALLDHLIELCDLRRTTQPKLCERGVLLLLCPESVVATPWPTSYVWEAFQSAVVPVPKDKLRLATWQLA